MLLKELLQTIPNSNIKVGADIAFVYCGANDNVATSVLQDIKGYKTKERQNLLDREVIECFDSWAYFEPNTKIIKVVGLEQGRYWTTEEFAKRYNKIKNKLQSN